MSIHFRRSRTHRDRAGAPGVMLSMLALLYVCCRFGFELAGPVGAIITLILFGGAEAVLAWATKPLRN
jgi:hypothetical protein